MNPISEKDVTSIFTIAKIPVLRIYQLAHSYYSFRVGEDEEETKRNAVYRATRPSWLVKTPFGLIALNLRKSVVEIDWSDTAYRAVKAPSKEEGMAGQRVNSDPDSITKDQVTKSSVVAHAYDLIKAAEYLSALGDHLKDMTYDAVQDALNAQLPGGAKVKNAIHYNQDYGTEDVVRAIQAAAQPKVIAP